MTQLSFAKKTNIEQQVEMLNCFWRRFVSTRYKNVRLVAANVLHIHGNYPHYFILDIKMTSSSDRDNDRRPNLGGLPKKDLGGAAYVRVCIRQEQFAKMASFRVDLKCFQMEQFLSQIIYRFSWTIQIRCRKLDFEILKTALS